MATHLIPDLKKLAEIRAVIRSDSGDSSSDSLPYKVAVTISGANGKADGANGEYILMTSNLYENPHYNKLEKGNKRLANMLIMRDGIMGLKRWVIYNGEKTQEEMRLGYIAGIDCPDASAQCDFPSLSHKTGWYILDDSGAKQEGKLPNMKAIVDTKVNPAEREPAPSAASPSSAALSSSSQSSSSSSSAAAASSSPAAVQAPPPAVVVAAPKSNDEMRDIYSEIDIQYNYISPRFIQLTADSTIDAIKNFETELDKKIEALRVAQQQLESFKNSGAQSGQGGGGSSSSSSASKKNRKSHKSYHPDIGKTRKHSNSHDEPKRVSFVHHA
jgi:hypothetical protein